MQIRNDKLSEPVMPIPDLNKKKKSSLGQKLLPLVDDVAMLATKIGGLHKLGFYKSALSPELLMRASRSATQQANRMHGIARAVNKIGQGHLFINAVDSTNKYLTKADNFKTEALYRSLQKAITN
jgi:hypothetical protein